MLLKSGMTVRRTSVVSLGLESVHRDGTLSKSQEYLMARDPVSITRSRCHPCDYKSAKVRRKIAEKCPPEDHDLAAPNLFSCTAPRFSVLTGNSPDANLSPVSARMLDCGNL